MTKIIVLILVISGAMLVPVSLGGVTNVPVAFAGCATGGC